ncbi:MAG: type II secretion system protein GspC [Deltaproteobacteria bacterium]|jgi:general secretion pathway protein C
MNKFYYILFNLAALFAIIYGGVDAFYRIVRAELMQVHVDQIVVEGAPHDKDYSNPPLSQYRVIDERNLFGLPEKGLEAVKEPEIETLEPTSLKLALLGTAAGDPESAVAVIRELDKNREGLFREGDSVQDAVVRKILRGRVVLRVGEKDEILTMEESQAKKSQAKERTGGSSRPRLVSEGEEGTIRLSRSELDSSLQNVNTLLSQVRIRPHFKDGRADGLAIHQIRSGSIFSRLGLRNGDIVQGIDDRRIQSPADIISVYRRLESGSPISLTINRRGQEKTLNYVFE